MTVNLMPISVKMVQRVREFHPMHQALAFLDTNDMVKVFEVQQRQPLVDNTNRQRMFLVVLGLRLQQQPLNMAMHQYKAVHRTIFGMRHSYLKKNSLFLFNKINANFNRFPSEE